MGNIFGKQPVHEKYIQRIRRCCKATRLSQEDVWYEMCWIIGGYRDFTGKRPIVKGVEAYHNHWNECMFACYDQVKNDKVIKPGLIFVLEQIVAEKGITSQGKQVLDRMIQVQQQDFKRNCLYDEYSHKPLDPSKASELSTLFRAAKPWRFEGTSPTFDEITDFVRENETRIDAFERAVRAIA